MFVRTIRLVLIILLLIFLLVVALARIYLYHNQHYDNRRLRKTRRAKYREKQVTSSEGAVICYAEGPNHGPPLLLIHDLGKCWEDFDPVLPALSKRYHVFAVDCFGHGGSSHLPELYRCDINGAALIWLIKKVIGGPCMVAGHGTGGILAGWMAAAAPDLVTGLVLEDAPFFRITPKELQRKEGTVFWRDSCLLPHEFLQQNEETDYAVYYAEHSIALELQYGNLQETVLRWVREYRSAHPAGPIRLNYVPYTHLSELFFLDRYDLNMGEALFSGRWIHGISQEEILHGIQCPVVYLKAVTRYSRDGILRSANSHKNAEKAQSLMEDCELEQVRSEHEIHHEKPRQFLAAVERVRPDAKS